MPVPMRKATLLPRRLGLLMHEAQRPDSTRVALQGELGAFSEQAVRELVAQAEPVPCWSFDEVVR